MRTLSIRQPWAWLIVNGHKDIENRDWSTAYRGQILVHAGKTMTRKYYDAVAAEVWPYLNTEGPTLPAFELLERGGVVGVTTITGCVEGSDSVWFNGPFGFTLADSRPLSFHACNGKLGYFDVQGVQT